jgi:hypothetical protein
VVIKLRSRHRRSGKSVEVTTVVAGVDIAPRSSVRMWNATPHKIGPGESLIIRSLVPVSVLLTDGEMTSSPVGPDGRAVTLWKGA